MAVLLIGAGAVAAAAALALTGKEKPAAPAPVAAAVPPTAEKPADGAVAPVPVPTVHVGTPVPPPPSGSGVVEEVASKAVDKALNVAFGTAASTVKLGIQALDVQRQVVTAIAGEGAGNAAVLNPALALGLTAKTAAETLGQQLGVPADINRRVAQTVGVAVGAPALLPIKATAEVVSLGIRTVMGAQAERTVRDVFKPLDITNSKNAVHAPVAAVAKGVSAAADFIKGGFTGLFGKKR